MAKRTKNGNKPPEEMPIFDYTNYSLKQQKAAQREQMRLMRLAEKLDRFDEWEDEDDFEEGLDQFETMEGDAMRRVTRFIVSIPRSWLVQGTPETLDWSDPESLGWLEATKLTELLEAADMARQPESVSGNSAKR